MEDGNKRKLFSFSFCELTDNPLEFNSRKIANILQIKSVEIRAIKFETTRIHFLDVVFAPVAVVVALAP